MSLPKPSFQQLKEKSDDSGIRSPKYPSTVTKVTPAGGACAQLTHSRFTGLCG